MTRPRYYLQHSKPQGKELSKFSCWIRNSKRERALTSGGRDILHIAGRGDGGALRGDVRAQGSLRLSYITLMRVTLEFMLFTKALFRTMPGTSQRVVRIVLLTSKASEDTGSFLFPDDSKRHVNALSM